MADFFDFDPLSGISHYTEYDETTGAMQIHTLQDIEPVLEYNKALAADERNFHRGVKKGWWLYAKIPPVIQLKLRAKGIDIHDPTCTKRLMQEINEHYPAFKCTDKNHAGIAPKIFVPGVSGAE